MKRFWLAIMLAGLLAGCGDDEVAALRKKAEGGDATAMYELSNLYRRGTEKQKADIVEADKWAQAAAEKGFPPAIHRMGMIAGEAAEGFRETAELGVGTAIRFFNREYSKAVTHWEKSSDLGYGPSSLKLAEAYFNGWGVKQDLKKAEEYAKKAISQGVPEGQRIIDNLDKAPPATGFGKSRDNPLGGVRGMGL